MAGTTTNLSYLLKRIYPQNTVENLVYQDNAFLAMVPKAADFEGSHIAVGVRYADPVAGRNVVFADAQTGTSNHKGVQFLVTRVKDYQVYSLETEAILAGRSDKGSLVRSLATEIDSALNNLGRSLAMALYHDGTGDIGTIGSVAAGTPTTYTLANAADITNFEVGMTVVVSNGSTKTNALRNSGTGWAITVVDRDAGTFQGAASNPDSAAAGDYIFIKGDRQAGAISAMTSWLRMAGLEAWNPVTAPAASESFFGIDRSPDASRLGGLRIDVSAQNPEEGLVIAMSRLAREGGRPDYMFLNFQDSRNIMLALGSKAETIYQSVGDVGFSTLRVHGPKGDIRIVPDQNCPVGIGRLLTLNTWKLHHLGDMINILDLDGNALSRKATADEFEGRAAFYGNLACTAPGMNARLVMPS